MFPNYNVERIFFMNGKRLPALLLLTVLFLAALVGCANGQKTYRSDVDVHALAEACGAKLASTSLMADADEDYLRYRMGLSESFLPNAVIRIQNAGTALDEFGILRAPDNLSPVLVEDTVKAYLDARNEEWTGLYLAEEYPKLRDAEYKVFGQYVVYAILSEEDRAALFAEAEAQLLK